jgi:hypothetical protein
MQTTKLVQITDAPVLGIGLDTEAGRLRLARQILSDIEIYAKQAYGDKFRKHLGASEIGHQCERYLWYKFRWMFENDFSGRMLRLFNRGHLEETRFLEWLEGIGFRPSNKLLQFSACGGHFGGTSDNALMLPVRYALGDALLLAEFKTQATGAAFNNLKTGGIKEEKPTHWNQVCTYGAALGFKYCIYVVINKNDDDLHVEILELDEALGHANIYKANRIITAKTPPEPISTNPSDYRCKYCDALSVCHLDAMPPRNCRSCGAATPINMGWHCGLFNQEIPQDFIEKGCDAWSALK